MAPGRREETLKRMQASRGIILDHRTRPADVDRHWFLSAFPSAIQDCPELVGYDPIARSSSTWQSAPRVAPAGMTTLKQPLVILIDETMVSAVEGFCMPFRYARRATFVGRVTRAANGGTSFITLPGGGRMAFTAERLWYPDGGRFQNIGIVPDVAVEDTIEGQLARRDEILEAGVKTILKLIADR